MKKKHVSPEFTVIKQDEANAKFFVASFENDGLAASQPAKTTSSVASNYSDEDNVDDLW